MKSKLFTLDIHDLINGLVVAVLSSAVGVILESSSHGEIVLNWKTICGAALIGGLGYIKKNFLTNDAGQFFKADKY